MIAFGLSLAMGTGLLAFLYFTICESPTISLHHTQCLWLYDLPMQMTERWESMAVSHMLLIFSCCTWEHDRGGARPFSWSSCGFKASISNDN